MDFDKLCADETKILTRHYTSGRSGQTITKVILHHNAGDLSIDGAYGVWQTREASAHYQVQSDGKIGLGQGYGVARGQLDGQPHIHRHRARGLPERPVAHLRCGA